MRFAPLLAAALLAAPPGAADGPGDPVFRTVVRRQGDDRVHTYRIPGLVTTPKGTLVAVFDVRHTSARDLPGDIDVGVMRSTDDGKTWGAMRIILDYDKAEKGALGNGVGDPAILVDRKTGHVVVLGLWSKGNRAWAGSGPGLSPDETGQIVMTRSTDDGVTWSPPVNLTRAVAGRDPKWRLVFQGPGSGIQLRDDSLVFAAQYRDAAGAVHSCFIRSTDGGATWALSPPAVPGNPPTSEAQIAELADGALLLSMRDESRSGTRGWARFDRAAGRWGEPWFAVPDPTCMASLIRHPAGPLVFTNPNSARERKGLTARTSGDGGKTWSPGRVIDPGPCGYSCAAVLKNGDVGVLYECGAKGSYETLTFARFPLAWARGE